MIIAILVFAPFHFDNLFLRLASRIVLIPVVAGIAYEFLRFTRGPCGSAPRAGADHTRPAAAAPDHARAGSAMLACAIAALKPVLAADGIEVAVVEAQPLQVAVGV